MSGFFGRSNNTPPPPQHPGGYHRAPASDGFSVSPRNALRPGPPPSAQYQPPAHGYNDAPNALFEKRSYGDRRSPAPPQQHRMSGSSHFNVVGSPNEALALLNCLICNPADFRHGQHVLVTNTRIDRGMPSGPFPATVKHDDTGIVQPGQISASSLQRQWMGLSVTGSVVTIDVLPPPPHPAAPLFLESIDIEINLFKRGQQAPDEFSIDDMASLFVGAFSGVIIAVDAQIAFEYRGVALRGKIKSISVLELPEEQRGRVPGGGGFGGSRDSGIIMERTDVNFLKASDMPVRLKGSAKKPAPNAILAPNFKFEDMGIGGLDNEFSEIFRRAFASRVFPPGLVEKLGIQHVKGIILHGPPGTGKTLIARQIGKMLNAKEPKIVNGPEILNKYVGASEENIRNLFADAEKEYKEKGDESGLHIIIFDELDAIFKQRGSTNSGTGVGDTVVNQLLSKMDGVDQLNNILIIGMTNRIDMIDEALLRPGRLEVHMEISLPDEKGRRQILGIHTHKMRTNEVMDDDVDILELAARTKNFSGAEIAGLIKSATSFAFVRHVKVGTMAGISDDVDKLKVNMQDFLNALEEVHPAFGVSEEELEQVMQNGIYDFDTAVDEFLRRGKLLVEQVRSSERTPLVSVLLYGSPGSGKTALAAFIAKESKFPFIKLISPDNMVGFMESQKVQAITKVFTDSYKSPLSVVVVDNIERLIGVDGLDYTPVNDRFSNSVLQTLLVLFARRPPKGRRLLIIATSSLLSTLKKLGLGEVFDSEQLVPSITTIGAFNHILRKVKLFANNSQLEDALQRLAGLGFRTGDTDDLDFATDEAFPTPEIGVKKLLSVIEMARQEPENVTKRLVDGVEAVARKRVRDKNALRYADA
ncbi:vesicular-fusion protein SEC18 [Macrolepiota fuliginosa MF-IS2]|uniref:Vesicular-fusion protein SEC18 n=1 Tax=Macrolepiota fuliginosa MF-IS2 TaxID=1400762 RepID=A0A9P5XFX9_9AGAR|nr:vesicular-fusion protein SEC18 [Macrolepiota fuliginosa MF-IS2]